MLQKLSHEISERASSFCSHIECIEQNACTTCSSLLYLDRKSTDHSSNLSILLFLLSNRLLKIPTFSTRGVSTPRGNKSGTLIDFVVRRLNSLSFYVQFCRTVVSFSWVSAAFQIYPMLRISSAKLKKFNRYCARNISYQEKYTRFNEKDEKNK